MPVFDLRAYMGGRYLVINHQLRGGLLLSGVASQARQDLVETVAQIDRELQERGRPVPGGQFLGREAGPAELYLHLVVDGEFSTPGYLSSSARPDLSFITPGPNAHNQAFFGIFCLQYGSRARDVTAVRANAAETEVIFPRNTRFRVIDKEHLARGNVRYYLRELPPGAEAVSGKANEPGVGVKAPQHGLALPGQASVAASIPGSPRLSGASHALVPPPSGRPG